MLAGITEHANVLTQKAGEAINHVLVVLPFSKTLPDRGMPGLGELRAALARCRKKPQELKSDPFTVQLGKATLSVWIMLDHKQSAFERHTGLRKALQLLLAEYPRRIAISVWGSEAERRLASESSVYVAWLNGVALPSRKKKTQAPLQHIELFGYRSRDGFAVLKAQAEGNLLARELTMLPPNELTPRHYRVRIRKMARSRGWKFEEFNMQKLRRMGAGAFVAVAQGSPDADAAIVHVRYRHPRARQTLALVGKGICFDTGGHNLKPARYMQGMHEDMNGSAVVLGILHAASSARLPVNLDGWLAIAQNHIGPRAYMQNDVVKALNGTTIEVVHTDAEGRMVLADTLVLASRAKPQALWDFATLTGSMVGALGTRYSGVLGNRAQLLQEAVEAGRESGERICAFPMDEDYDAALDSKIADVKQCSLEAEADHILASRFLQRFAGEAAWLHMDLSAANCKEGLGAVSSEVTGFGVAWGMAMLQRSLRK